MHAAACKSTVVRTRVSYKYIYIGNLYLYNKNIYYVDGWNYYVTSHITHIIAGGGGSYIYIFVL